MPDHYPCATLRHMDPLAQFLLKLRQAMALPGMTQKKLGAAVGLSQSMVSRYLTFEPGEEGAPMPSFDVAMRLMDLVGKEMQSRSPGETHPSGATPSTQAENLAGNCVIVGELRKTGLRLHSGKQRLEPPRLSRTLLASGLQLSATSRAVVVAEELPHFYQLGTIIIIGELMQPGDLQGGELVFLGTNDAEFTTLGRIVSLQQAAPRQVLYCIPVNALKVLQSWKAKSAIIRRAVFLIA